VRIGFERSGGERLVIDREHMATVDATPDLLLHVGDACFHPGLINAHDHLYRNHYPRLGSPPYADAYAWGVDIHERCRAAIDRAESLSRRAALLFGAFKNILGGVTTVVHHDPWHEALADDTFPVRVARVRVLHSLGFERDVAAAVRALRDAGGRMPLCLHLAEGTNARAAAEIEELASHGLLDERLLTVHVVGIDEAGIARLRAANATIVWCPTSNHYLLGHTAPRALFASGIDTLLGTDSLLTGAGTLLDELRAAREHRYLDDERLLAAVGVTAARRLGLAAPTLSRGAVADVIMLRAPVFEARSADVAIVLVGGRPVFADASLAEVFAATGVAGEPIVVGGVPKVVAAPLATIAQQVFELSPDCARIVA
jgi:cytosine/adenosine deaminase-related metal-dependent hydrolase